MLIEKKNDGSNSSGLNHAERCLSNVPGSGQLAYDTQQCVRTNALGLAPPVWRRWAAAFEPLVLEGIAKVLAIKEREFLR